MKKLSFLFLPLLTIQAMAQTFGVKAGAAFSTYQVVALNRVGQDNSKSNITTSPKTGILVGGYVDFGLGQHLFLRPGIELVTKGAMEEGTYQSNGVAYPYGGRYNFTAFDIPLNLLYQKKTGGGRFLLGGGLVPGILIEGGLKKFDLGVDVQAGYEFASGLNANIAYTHGLLNTVQYSLDYSSLKNRHLGVTLGYSFRRDANVKPAAPETRTDAPQVLSGPAKAVYTELGGPGGILSFNYDTRFSQSQKGWGLRAGVGLLLDPYGAGFTLPVALNYLAGEKTHFLELAAGASFFHFEQKNQDGWYDFPQESFLAPFAWAGYRYQPLSRKFVFRAGFTQFIGVEMDQVFRLPMPSLSFGYSIR